MHPLHKFLPLAVILASPWVVPELLVGKELAQSLLGRGHGMSRKRAFGLVWFYILLWIKL